LGSNDLWRQVVQAFGLPYFCYGLLS
jgi:hypothetical protein